jgi:NTP pyrophosphatase (non-canonical NTP hydrolase)
MDFNQYSSFVLRYSEVYQVPEGDKLLAVAFGLAEETGEAIGHLKRLYRGDGFDRDAWLKELGDVLAYLSLCAEYTGSNLEEVAQINIAKLTARERNETQFGSGDNR